jgi:uncharacterized protein YjbJ (UPF0337 family)
LAAVLVGKARDDRNRKPGGNDMPEYVDKTRNVAERGVGKVQETAGAATGDRSLQAKGVARQAKGKAKTIGERIKDIFRH